MTELSRPRLLDLGSGDLHGTEPPPVFVVGDVELWRGLHGDLPRHRHVAFASIDELREALADDRQPGLVLSPVVSRDFDCLDIAYGLAASGYRGAYRAVAQNLPYPEIVRHEVRHQFPRLDFDILPIEGVAAL